MLIFVSQHFIETMFLNNITSTVRQQHPYIEYFNTELRQSYV